MQLISKHINDVEALGDIGGINLDEIAKALARNRSLTPQNAPLFYDIQNTRLTLYDATSTLLEFLALGKKAQRLIRFDTSSSMHSGISQPEFDKPPTRLLWPH